MERLLEDSREAFYWMGFILADGHLSKAGRLKICLAKRDANHVKLFRDFIGVGEIHTYKYRVEVQVMNTNVAEKLRRKFDISNNKTTRPPDISKYNFSDDLMTAMKIGFIDGDGCIQHQTGRKDTKISIKVHSAWVDILKVWFGKGYLNACGYAFVSLTNSKDIIALKKQTNGLPVLRRKWDKVDSSFVSRYTKAEINKRRAVELRKQGWRNIDIAEILGISKGGVSMIFKRMEKLSATNEVPK